eukprot:g30202.t1
MEFTLDKCEVLHFRQANQRGLLHLMVGPWGVLLNRGLRVQVHRFLNVGSQPDKVVKKVFVTLRFIGQNSKYGCWDVMLWLYKTL